jgi:hypothetical protein
MQKIENIDELIKFITTNFDRIAPENYCNICFKSLGLITNKPKTVAEATEEIQKYYDLVKHIPEGWERPLWVMEGDFDE